MKFYQEFSSWWPLFSAPEEYAEEAGLYLKILSRYKKDIGSCLELGSGGGNNAFYLKNHFNMTLTDLSPGMLEISKKLNPECRHFQGDMRHLDLGETFDLVFVHDSIMSITTQDDLADVFKVASRHLHKKGILLIVPDFFRETFEPSTTHGGHDGSGKSLRYLEWTVDGDPGDNIVETDYVFIMREISMPARVFHDRETSGIFSRQIWKELLEKEGFIPTFEVIDHKELKAGSYVAIVCTKKPENTENT